MIYTLKKCEHCIKAKEHLMKLNVPFEEIDLSAKENGAARKFYRDLGVKVAPIIIGRSKKTGQEWTIWGFDEIQLESKLKEGYD